MIINNEAKDMIHKINNNWSKELTSISKTLKFSKRSLDFITITPMNININENEDNIQIKNDLINNNLLNSLIQLDESIKESEILNNITNNDSLLIGIDLNSNYLTSILKSNSSSILLNVLSNIKDNHSLASNIGVITLACNSMTASLSSEIIEWANKHKIPTVATEVYKAHIKRPGIYIIYIYNYNYNYNH